MISRSTAVLCAAVIGAAGAVGGCSSDRGSGAAGSEPPAGFSPTAHGEVLDFGETAHIITVNPDSGAPVYWDVTVERPRTLRPSEVEENIGQDPGAIGLPDPEETDAPAPKPERYTSFTCFVATFTPVATAQGDYSVTLPTLRTVDRGGGRANFVEHGDNDYCGVSPDDEVPTFTGDMEIGRAYTQAVVTWEGADDPGIPGAGVELSTAPDPSLTQVEPQSVRWQ
ncbi:hypothetical protein SAMN04488535_1253 [Corynebacterium mycetoides]|uniref:Uncharacterized protein n=1 Tax=Corynebacterium mycetoides TaxID=38302 RepID=A0A1G9P0S1_9CORY|nr:hypothetical protein [Corynebacterium mycetoides]SDL92153.1 hypothetical protein SAMN04488535_1253 [Corynebacterium mycetoides]